MLTNKTGMTGHGEQSEVAPSIIESRESQGVQSKHGSTTHPYQSLLKDTSFARCHPVVAPMCSTQTYARALLRLGNGTPLWDPIGNVARSKPHLKSSIMIGDVGYFDIQGNFAYYFNIFLPRSDPAQYYCPPDFEPLLPSPSPSELATNAKYFPPGTTLVSPGIEVSRESTTPLDIRFTVTAREGGILILPDGASRQDMVETDRVRDFVLKHARDWYIFMNQGIHYRVMCSNGQLCVVTGHDKATSWAASVALPYHDASKLREICYSNDDWTMNPDMDSKTSHVIAKYDIDHCALFLRTMRFALSTRDWTEHLLNNDPPETLAFHCMPTVPVLGLRTFYQRLKNRVFKRPDKTVSGECYELTFHPLEVVLQYLVESTPSNMATLDDSVWNVVASETDGSLLCTSRALVKLLYTHDISVKNGYVTLIPHLTSSSAGGPLPDLLTINFKYWRRRRAIETKVSKIFPGPGLPSYLLRPGSVL